MKKEFFQIIKTNKYFSGTILGAFIALFWFLNFHFFEVKILNFVLFILYFWLNGFYLGKILRKFFKIEFSFILGLVYLFFLINFFLSVFIVFYKIEPIYLFVILGVVSILLSLINSFLKKEEKEKKRIFSIVFKIFKKKEDSSIPAWWKICFIVLYFSCLLTLAFSRTSSVIRSPWQFISSIYIYLYLALFFLVLYVIKFKPNLKFFILIVVLFSLLCHSYLFFPYQAGFGGDKWRHLGVEKWLMQGNTYLPVLFPLSKASFLKIGGMKIPEVFLVGNKTSYSNFWAGVISLSWLLSIDPFWVDIFLGMMLYSLFFPFLLYELARKIFQEKINTYGYYFIFVVPFLFFPFILYGSISIPLSYGLFPFCLSLIFLLNYLNQKISSKEFLAFFILFALVLYLNYILYFILYLSITVFVIIYRQKRKLGLSLTLLLILLFIGLGIVFPCLDTFRGYSALKEGVDIENSLTNFSLGFLGFKAIFPRLNGFEQDNWLYSGIEENLTNSIFGEFSLYLQPFFILLFWFLVFLGFLHLYKLSPKHFGLIFGLILSIAIAQFISSNFLEGSRLFSKRLVLFHSFLFFFPLSLGIYSLFSYKKELFIPLIIVLSFFATTVYISGPKFDAVTGDELRAAKYVWSYFKENSQDKEKNYCVIGNTWPLLALEGVSGEYIIAGGFPVYQEYAQPERVSLFENLNRSPHINDFKKALKITQAKSCFFMTEDRWITQGRKQKVIESLNKIAGQPTIIGDVYIWYYQPNSINL